MGPVREMLAGSKISEQKWRVLRVIDESGPIEQTLIAQNACLLLPSLTRLLAAMEDDGLVVRATDTIDRRKTIATISAKGRALIDEHTKASQAIFSELEKQFGKDRLEALLDLLEDLQDVKFD